MRSRLYAVLDADVCAARGLEPLDVAGAWFDAGVRLLQLRAKRLAGRPFLDLADRISSLAHDSGSTFIVNDRADVAKLAGAAGVHVGQTDLIPTDARAVVGGGAIVGISTHNDPQVTATLREPVDYVAIGPVFSTMTKDRPDPVVGLAGVQRAARIVAPSGRPLVAIGGITLDLVPDVLAAGAASVAVISDLFAGDPQARAREYLRVVGEA